MDVSLIFAHLHIQLVSKAEIKLSGSASVCKGLSDVSLSSEGIQYVEALCGRPRTSEFSSHRICQCPQLSVQHSEYICALMVSVCCVVWGRHSVCVFLELFQLKQLQPDS